MAPVDRMWEEASDSIQTLKYTVHLIKRVHGRAELFSFVTLTSLSDKLK